MASLMLAAQVTLDQDARPMITLPVSMIAATVIQTIIAVTATIEMIAMITAQARVQAGWVVAGKLVKAIATAV